MCRLTSRERRIFSELSSVVLERSGPIDDKTVQRVEQMIDQATAWIHIFFRVSLQAFEWGTLLLQTNSGRYEHFSRMPVPAKRRYVRYWLHHKSLLVRQTAIFLKIMVMASHYDDRSESARVGYAPKWLC